MIKYKKNCAVCNTIKQNKKLAKQIYQTTAYDKSSKTSLLELHKQYKDSFSYDSLKNHVKKHQAISAEDLQEKQLQDIVKKAEAELVKKKIESKDIWDTILDMGHQQIESGEIRLRASDVTRAAKDKADYELKVKDQELAMIEMVYHFASGENKPNIIGKINAEPDRTIIEAEIITDNNPAQDTTGDAGPGEDRPGGVYYPPTWDAPTFGSGEVSERDY